MILYTEREKEVLGKIKVWKEHIEAAEGRRREGERKGPPERVGKRARPPFPGCGRCVRW